MRERKPFLIFTLCFIKNNDGVWSEGFGLYDLEKQKNPSEHTIYNMASVTKTVKGAALIQLYKRGLFGLDDDINDYFFFNLRNLNFLDVPDVI